MEEVDFTLTDGSESEEESGVAELVHVSEDYDIYIGRADGFKHLMNTAPGERGWLGNPFPLEKFSREEAVDLYEKMLRRKLEKHDEFRQKFKELKGKKLGRYCGEDELCHGDIILKILEEQENQQEDESSS